jgi:hypothetical protein
MAKDIPIKNKDNKSDGKSVDAFGIFAIVLFVIALITFVFTISEGITGNASGYVNITVFSRLEVNVTNAIIQWGNGTIDANELNATLYTSQTSSSISRGNWTADPDAISVENIGNVNTTIELQASINASGLFGAVGSQRYMWNVSNKDPGSCFGGDNSVDTWYDANITSTKYCDDFGYIDGADEIYLDVKLTVPYNTTNFTTELYDVITITASAT